MSQDDPWKEPLSRLEAALEAALDAAEVLSDAGHLGCADCCFECGYSPLAHTRGGIDSFRIQFGDDVFTTMIDTYGYPCPRYVRSIWWRRLIFKIDNWRNRCGS